MSNLFPDEKGLSPEKEDALIRIYNNPSVVKGLEGGNYLFMQGAMTQALDIVCSEIPLNEPIYALDLGCGGGRGGKIILDELQKRNRFGRWVGVDISESMLSNAHKEVGGRDNAELINDNFRRPHEELKEYSRKFNLITAFGTGDGFEDYFKHIYDVLKYATDGAVVLVVEYPHIPERINLDTAATANELGISFFEMAKMALKSPIASAKFAQLGISNEDFKNYSLEMNTLDVRTMLNFAQQASAEVAIINNSSNYSPIIMRFKVTPDLRERVEEHFRES